MFKRLRDTTLAVILSALIPVTSFAQTLRPSEEGSPSQVPQAELSATPLQINLDTFSPQSFSQPNSLEEIPAAQKENEALRLKAPVQDRLTSAQQTARPIPAFLTSNLSSNNKESAQRFQPTAKGNFARAHLFLENIQKNLPWKNPSPESPLLSGEYKNPSATPIERSDVQIFVPVSKIVSQLKNLAQENPAAAWAKAREILNDPSEKRLIVRVSAFEILKQAPLPEAFPEALSILDFYHKPHSGEDYSPREWYLAREAVKFIGEHAIDLSAEQQNQALERLKDLSDLRPFIDRLSNVPAIGGKKIAEVRSLQSVSNMANWALGRFGETTPLKVFAGSAQERKEKRGNPEWIRRIPWMRAATIALFIIGVSIPILSHYTQMPPLKQPASVIQTQKPSPAPKAPPFQIKKPASPKERELNEIKRHDAKVENLLTQWIKSQQKPKLSGWATAKNMIWNIFIFFGPIALIMFMMRRGMGTGGLKSKKINIQAEKPSARFSDIGGVDESLLEVQEIADYLRNPKKWLRAGATPPKGVLLVGPPGTGKTLLAKALAGESDAAFLPMTGSNFVEMYVGMGAARVRELFREAKEKKPSIIFIDEIDAMGKARQDASSNGNGEREQTLNQLLTEIDGFDGSEGVVVIAATNREDVLDPALTRPGRFDRKVYVGNPDALGRKAVLAIHAGKASLDSGVNLDFIVRRTTGFSGAELAGIIEEAKRLAVRKNRTDVSPEDINEAIDKMTVGIERNLAVSTEIKKRIAYHEAGHVLAGFFSGQPLANKLTIIPHGGQALGYAEPAPENEDDTFLLTKTQLKRRLVGLMGGRAAEEIIFGETSTGPGNDIEQAERLARNMVEKLGMDDKVGLLTSGANAPGIRKTSEMTAREMDQAVNSLLNEALTQAKTLLQSNRAILESVVQSLLEKETLEREDLARIINGRSK